MQLLHGHGMSMMSGFWSELGLIQLISSHAFAVKSFGHGTLGICIRVNVAPVHIDNNIGSAARCVEDNGRVNGPKKLLPLQSWWHLHIFAQIDVGVDNRSTVTGNITAK